MAVFLRGSESSDITRPGKGWRTTQDTKLAIVALGLGMDSLIMMNSAANFVVEDPTLLFQADLVPDGSAVWYKFTERRRRMERDNRSSTLSAYLCRPHPSIYFRKSSSTDRKKYPTPTLPHRCSPVRTLSNSQKCSENARKEERTPSLAAMKLIFMKKG